MSKSSQEVKAELEAKVGAEVGVTDWVLVDQARIQAFADATLDQQWIHTDPEMAKKGPFGGPIAHGLLSLSLLPHFSEQVDWAPRAKMSVNYGYDKVRFTSPVPSGSKVRSRLTLQGVDVREDGGLSIKVVHTIEREGALVAEGNRPVLVAESLGLLYY